MTAGIGGALRIVRARLEAARLAVRHADEPVARVGARAVVTELEALWRELVEEAGK